MTKNDLRQISCVRNGRDRTLDLIIGSEFDVIDVFATSEIELLGPNTIDHYGITTTKKN